ncbi:MAG: DUF424 family protein [Nanoarchaeota archaeon]
MSLVLKAHKTDDGRYFVVIIDKELIGKKFDDGELQLDLTSQYYNGDESDEERVLKVLSKAYSATFVGKKSVELGISKGYIEKERVIQISGIPTSQSLSTG